MNKTKRAFTLIELLVVISIIGLLSSIAMVSLNGARAKARDVKRMNDLKMMSDAIERYNLDNNGYPLDGYDAGYLEENCGSAGVLDYYDVDINDMLLCSGHPFKSESSVYLDSIPKSQDSDWIKYDYDATTLAETPPKNPCIYSYLEETDNGAFFSFVCQDGNCKKSTDDPLVACHF